VPAFDWRGFLANPAIDTPHNGEYLDQVAILDVAQCQSPEDLVRFFHRMDETEGTRLSPAAERAFRGNAEEALLAWGVPAGSVTTLCDRNLPLTFHSLYDKIRTASKADTSIPTKAELAVAIAGASLVAPAISGAPVGEHP
jgi:hypothetical protein